MMKYKDIMGYSKKKKPDTKKIVKEEPRPSITDLLKEEFGDIELGKVYTAKDKPPFKTEQTINETLPALGREWSKLDKACKILYKAVDDLAKGAGRVDKKHAKEILGLWKYTSSNIKKFKELVSKEVLSKLQ